MLYRNLIFSTAFMATMTAASTVALDQQCVDISDVNILIGAMQSRTSWTAGIPSYFPPFLIPQKTRVVGSITSQTYSKVVLMSEGEPIDAHNSFREGFVAQDWRTHTTGHDYFAGQRIDFTTMCHEKQGALEIGTRPWGGSSLTILSRDVIDACTEREEKERPRMIRGSMGSYLPLFGPPSGDSWRFVTDHASDSDARRGMIIKTDIGPERLQRHLSVMLTFRGWTLDTTWEGVRTNGSSWHTVSAEGVKLIATVSVALLAPSQYRIDLHVIRVGEQEG